MKIREVRDEQGLTLRFEGPVTGANEPCLRSFQASRLAPPPARLTFDMTELDELDAAATAVLTSLIRELRRQCAVSLRSPPQTLAHTLYKTAALEGAGAVTIIDPREEEPYAG